MKKNRFWPRHFVCIPLTKEEMMSFRFIFSIVLIGLVAALCFVFRKKN